MGSNDIPPPHVNANVIPISNLLLQVGGALWTACYILYLRESLKSKSYGMPLFALALNFGWEFVYALFVAESPLERTVFTVWLAIDLGLIYGVTKFGKHEWKHAPWIARNVGVVFVALATVAIAGHWTFAKWWIDNSIGMRDGKIYRGVVGPDTTELGFWSAAFCQTYLSAASLIQLLVRQHSGGVSWSIWGTRTLGSIVGLYGNYGCLWWFWTDAHEYFTSPFAMFLWIGALVCDLMYAPVLWHVRANEVVLADGRREMLAKHVHPKRPENREKSS